VDWFEPATAARCNDNSISLYLKRQQLYDEKNCTLKSRPVYLFLLGTFLLQMAAPSNSHQKMQKKEEDDRCIIVGVYGMLVGDGGTSGDVTVGVWLASTPLSLRRLLPLLLVQTFQGEMHISSRMFQAR
jgi:hypothetical protein